MTKPSQPALIVALGASAGGLAAIQLFFEKLPSDCRSLTYVVVQHLSPEHRCMMKELLERATDIRVQMASDGAQLRGNAIFLMPASCDLVVRKGRLRLIRGSQAHLPIDRFLHSLAEDAGDRAVAMIFSGIGSDGSIGLLAVKEAGGLAMVQEECSAEYPDMPRAAIETGAADFILTPDEMAFELASYAEYVAALESPVTWSADHTSRLFEALLARVNIDFSGYKREPLLRRVRRRLAVRQAGSLGSYTELLQRDPQEAKLLTTDLLIGVTRFFRDPEAFNELERQVAALFEADRPLRIWVPGCSTGEEVYSVLMLFHERAASLGRPPNIKVFATDLNSDALRIASLGCYHDNIEADVSSARLERFFCKRPGGGYQVSAQLREQVVFSLHNLVQDPPLRGINLVSCRNLLMYFESELQKKVLSVFHFSLLPDGLLFLGARESVSHLQGSFDVVDSKARIYRKLGISAGLHRWPNRSSRPFIDPARQLSRAVDQGQRLLLEEHCPPSILVDRSGQVVHVFVVADRYLSFPAGPVRLQLTDLLPTALAAVASGALSRAFQQTECPEMLIEDLGLSSAVALSAQALPNPEGKSEFALVTFRAIPSTRPTPMVITPHSRRTRQQILSLRQELALARANFQTTIEELETANEELQATCEEFQATNQEHQANLDQLRSALKQANQEICGLSSHYQSRLEELSSRVVQLEDFLCAAQPAALFLDGNLNILYSTPGVHHYLPLQSSDCGRPVAHFAPNFNWPDFIQDARRVLEERVWLTFGLRTNRENQPFRLTLSPMARTGVIVTFALIEGEVGAAV